MKNTDLSQLIEDRLAKRATVLAIDLESGKQALFHPTDGGTFEFNGHDISAALHIAVAADRSTTVTYEGGEVFLNVFNPPLRMIIVGAVHIAQPLARMAALTGYDVTVVDPRRAFGTTERFPGVTLNDAWPDVALDALAPDHRTAVVTLTHDPKLDDPALDRALRSDAFYIGSLGSRKTHAARLERLRRAGFSDQEVARIHGPVGLAIGAKSPAEIATSIIAQVTQILRGGGSVREKSTDKTAPAERQSVA